MDNNLNNFSVNSSFMLTTLDNPFNPFTNFDEWYAFDVQAGYNTCSYLARVSKSSDELSDEDEIISIEEAIDEIIKMNLNDYVRIYRDSKKGFK